jgi:cytochrome c1
MAGPTLANLSRRSILAGQLPNNPENLIGWIEHPQQIKPGDGMPELGVNATDARDMAAYLYTLH